MQNAKSRIALETLEMSKRRLCEDSAVWKSFLKTAANNYKYKFDEQIMIHTARPNATACAEYDQWRELVNRQVARGSKGIPLIDGNGHFRHVFDITDTVALKGAEPLKPPSLWEVDKDSENAFATAIAERFTPHSVDDNNNLINLENAVIHAARQLRWDFVNSDSYRPTLKQLAAIAGESDIPDDGYGAGFTEKYGEPLTNMIDNSVIYTVLSKCGYNAELYFENNDFDGLKTFDNPHSMSILGEIVNSMSKDILRTAETAATKIERNQENERNADINRVEPNRNRPSDRQRTDDVGRPHDGLLRGRRRKSSPTATRTDPVRQGAVEIPVQPPPESVLSNNDEHGVVQSLDGNRADGVESGGTAHLTNDESGKLDREPQIREPNAVGGNDEQLSAIGAGNRDERADTSTDRGHSDTSDNGREHSVLTENTEAGVEETPASSVVETNLDIPETPEKPNIVGECERIKQENGADIVMWQLGDFYEMFGSDAVTSEAVLNVTLTQRNMGFPEPTKLTGIPKHTLNDYLQKWNDEGYNVAVSHYSENGARTVTVHNVDTETSFDVPETPKLDIPETPENSVITADCYDLDNATYEIYPNGKCHVEVPMILTEAVKERLRQHKWDEENTNVAIKSMDFVNNIDHAMVSSEPALVTWGNFMSASAKKFFTETEYQTMREMSEKAVRANSVAKSEQLGLFDFTDESAKLEKPETPPLEASRAVPDLVEEEPEVIITPLYPHLSKTAEINEPPKSKGENFRITDENLGVGGAKEKFKNNIAAIKLLQEIERAAEFHQRISCPAGTRPPYPNDEEKETLSRYVGWGSMPQAFDEKNTSWSGEYTLLKELLSTSEYEDARESTLNAHYTSPTVIKAIYEGLENLGFKAGNVLEPSMGVGNFFGMLPESMQNSKLYGVELDDITGRIAKQLYTNADIKVRGFEQTNYSDNFFDVAVGNVPFGVYL